MDDETPGAARLDCHTPGRMNGPSLLIFDLDGTISDPAVGIGRSINYALAVLGYSAVSLELPISSLILGWSNVAG